ncbi:hypothetical protein [Singulisphaera sp. PoT]|uniref:hypothetical protein n=1 Tax=Singulisphaera sp. PoT TaxID=3411797 RepID=UPI003BF60B22
MSMQEGPSIKIAIDCFYCKHRTYESYRVQGDSGGDHYCTHPKVQQPRQHIGDGTTRTPDWCPLKKEAVKKFVKELFRRGGSLASG